MCRYLEHRGTVKGSSKRNALFSEKFDQIESALYLFGFTKRVSDLYPLTFETLIKLFEDTF